MGVDRVGPFTYSLEPPADALRQVSDLKSEFVLIAMANAWSNPPIRGLVVYLSDSYEDEKNTNQTESYRAAGRSPVSLRLK